MNRWIAGLCVLGAMSTVAAADNELGGGSKPSDSFTLKVPDPVATFYDRKPRVFGEKGSEWWSASAGVAYNFTKATDVSIRGAWSRFLIQDVELSLELNAWYFDQPGDSAYGINPAFVFRWHFINIETWSIYGDIGIGPLITTDVVPEGGTSFDFMPRAGVGFTRLLDDAGDRLQVGVRWHHISNARIAGDSHNPSRDGAMVYIGVMFPF